MDGWMDAQGYRRAGASGRVRQGVAAGRRRGSDLTLTLSKEAAARASRCTLASSSAYASGPPMSRSVMSAAPRRLVSTAAERRRMACTSMPSSARARDPRSPSRQAGVASRGAVPGVEAELGRRSGRQPGEPPQPMPAETLTEQPWPSALCTVHTHRTPGDR